MSSQEKSKSPLSLRGTTVTLVDLIKQQYIARSLPALPKAKIRSSQYGGHVSKLRGRGIEFDEVRIYQAGDDIKRMDWKVTAKTGKPHTKLFHDERDRPVYLLIDDRTNMQFGTRVAFKSVIAAQIASIIAWATINNGDKLGAVIANGIDPIELKPYMRKAGVLPLLKILSTKDRQHGSSSLEEALIRLRHVVMPGSLVFIISDFYNIGKDFEKHLSRVKMHNEIVSCFIYDILEKEPPLANAYQISNGKKWLSMDTNNAKFCRDYRKIFQSRYDDATKIFNKWNIPMLEFATDEVVSDVLLKSFSGRKI